MIPLRSLSTVRFCFFYGSAPYRDLHSFPTRRSSDLRRGSRRRPARSSRGRRARQSPPPGRAVPAPSPGSRGFHRAPRDRKSTRLNSSHLGISYAVFCLKKKKRKTTQETTPENNQRQQ